jgi:hypothetical protein
MVLEQHLEPASDLCASASAIAKEPRILKKNQGNSSSAAQLELVDGVMYVSATDTGRVVCKRLG